MFCTIYRWLISRSMDSPGPLSRRVAKHVAQCPACRDYRDRCVELGDRLAGEAGEQAGLVSDELHARILLRCGAGAEATMPRTMPRLNSRRFRLGLAVAAAAAVVIALMAWQFYPATTQQPKGPIVEHKDRPKPGPAPVRIARIMDSRWLAVASDKASDAIDRSMNEQFDQLRQSGRDAAGFVLARMPIDIDLP